MVSEIYMPGRILDRNVGGNTTYARYLERGLTSRGIAVHRIAMERSPWRTMLAEDSFQRRIAPPPGGVVHYVADTGALLRGRWPTVVTVHGVASRWIRTARNRRQEFVWRSRVKRSIASADHIITVSDSSANDICEVFDVDRANLTVIHHGIEAGEFSAPTTPSPEVAPLLPPEFLLYVGNIEPRKNLIELIAAVDSNPQIPPLVIAGKPAWNFSESMEAIKRSSRVTYLGFVSDADRRALMARCTAFVFPSLYEGFGFPVLEAMAAGSRVITTTRGSLSEVAGPAWKLAGTEREHIAQGVEDALGDQEWFNRSPRAGEAWVEQFSWSSSVDEHLRVYERIS